MPISKTLLRPANINDAEIDSFVSKSFDIYDYTFDTDEELDKLDSLFTICEKDSTRITEGTALKMNSSLKTIKSRCNKSKKEVTALISKAKTLTENASSDGPKTITFTAIKNINLSRKALKISRKKSKEQLIRFATYSTKMNALYK